MPRMSKDLKNFHDALIEIAKYLVILDPTILQYYDFDNYQCDEFPGTDRKKYKYHPLVLDQLRYNNQDRADDIEHCYGVRLIKTSGGNEGQEGVPYYYIFKFYDKFYKLPGHYSSYDDSPLYWDSIHEVKPEEKTLTVYKRVDGVQEDEEYIPEMDEENDQDSF